MEEEINKEQKAQLRRQLREVRKKHLLNVEQLAVKIGIHSNTLRKFLLHEEDDVTIMSIYKIINYVDEMTKPKENNVN